MSSSRRKWFLATAAIVAVAAVSAVAFFRSDEAPLAEAPSGSGSSSLVPEPDGTPAGTPESRASVDPTAPPGDPTLHELRSLLVGFPEDPPVVHGRFESITTDGTIAGETLTGEVWVDWPSFRLVYSGEDVDPFVIATRDGKRFGYRDPSSGDTGITRDFGEAAFFLAPLMQFFDGETKAACASTPLLRSDEILGRETIRISCNDAESWKEWIDRETGFDLRYVPDESPSNSLKSWSYVEIEFDPELDPQLFDPRSV